VLKCLKICRSPLWHLINKYLEAFLTKIQLIIQSTTYTNQGRIQPVSLGGAISIIFGSQVSVGSQKSFRIVQNHGKKVNFVGFRGAIAPFEPTPGFAPDPNTCKNRQKSLLVSRASLDCYTHRAWHL